jgi:hypothetical protein
VVNFEQTKPRKFADCPKGRSVERNHGSPGTSKYEEYRLYAEHCLNLVRIAASRESRVIQREMAAEWFKLADMFSTAE